MADIWVPGRCNETAGFLFRHECGELPMNQCVHCQKPLCEKHTHLVEEGPSCTTCVRQSATRTGDLEDDPYFYGDRYYSGYGRYGHGHWGHYWVASHAGGWNDPHDFTEADAESLRNEGEEDFESDMTES